MTDPRLYDAFDDCLTRLSAGESLDVCLKSYSDMAGELQLMLESAQQAMAASHVPHQAQMRDRARFLTAAGKLRAPRPSLLSILLRRSLSTAVAVLLAGILATTGLYYASASTLPGDGLYPVKRMSENIQINLARDPAARFALEQEFDKRRGAELQVVLEKEETVAVTFGALLVSNSGDHWQVGDFTVMVDAQTVIVGEPQPGFYVCVVAESNAGILKASEIKVEEVEVTGQLLGGGREWTIAGAAFVTVPETVITGTLQNGAMATARIRTLHSGDHAATYLTILAPTVVPSSTPTSTPTLTHTPEPTETDEPTPTPTEEPSQTPRPTNTRKPSNTPEPSATEVRTPEPTHTPESGGGNDNGGNDNSGNDNGGDDHGGNDNSGDDHGGNDNSGGGSGGGG